jgi:hypothetical protein
MRGRALRPLTSASLRSDSLYDFIAQVTLNTETTKKPNYSSDNSIIDKLSNQRVQQQNNNNTSQKLSPLDLGTVEEEAKRSRYPRPTLVPPTSRGGARKLPINRARFNSEALEGEREALGMAKVKRRPSPTEEQSGRERDEPKPNGSCAGILGPAARRGDGRRSPPSVPRGSIPAEELSRRRQKGMGATGSGGAGWALFAGCSLGPWGESEEVTRRLLGSAACRGGENQGRSAVVHGAAP